MLEKHDKSPDIAAPSTLQNKTHTYKNTHIKLVRLIFQHCSSNKNPSECGGFPFSIAASKDIRNYLLQLTQHHFKTFGISVVLSLLLLPHPPPPPFPYVAGEC